MEVSVLRKAGRWFVQNRLLFTGFLLVFITVFVIIFGSLLVKYNPGASDFMNLRLTKPLTDPNHILGVDYIGRDLLARLIVGLRTSLLLSILSVVFSTILGVIIGVSAGFNNPGPLDTVLMRFADVLMGFPFAVLAMVLLTLLGSNISSLILVLSIAGWPTLARTIRATVTLQRGMDYISAGRVAGAGKLRIAVKYIGSNIWPTLLPLTPLNIASAIINESLMSFIQIGIQPPGISLGTIMADGKSYIATDWWITGIPGFVIMFVVLGLNFIGDSFSNKLSQLGSR